MAALLNATSERAAACTQLVPFWDYCDQHGISRQGKWLTPEESVPSFAGLGGYIDNLITSNLGQFVNFNSSGGVITGRNIFTDYNPPNTSDLLPWPSWTMEDALAFIGITPDWIPASANTPLLAAWAWQKKKFLDLMLWKKVDSAEFIISHGYIPVRLKRLVESCTEMEWNSATWHYGGAPGEWFDGLCARHFREPGLGPIGTVERKQAKPYGSCQIIQLSRRVKSYWFLGTGGMYMSLNDPTYYLTPDWPPNPNGQVAFNANGDSVLDMKWSNIPEATFLSPVGDEGLVTPNCWLAPGEGKPVLGWGEQKGYTSWMYPYHCGPFPDFWGDPFVLWPRTILELNIPEGYVFQPQTPITVHPS